LSKICFRRSDKPLKSGILTFRGKLKLSVGYPVERHAFSHENLQKVKTLCGFYLGKSCLDAE
jgi:hypothetical protein